MLNLINSIVARAQANRQRIVLPEGTEERTLKAANQILTDEVADLILLGNPEEINADSEISTGPLLLILRIIRRKKNMRNCCANSVRKKV